MSTAEFNTSQISAISRLFSASVFRELAVKGRSPLFTRLVQQSDLLSCNPHLDHVSDVFETAFSVLKKGKHRDEYIYRAALTEKILLGKHSLNTASILNEFRVENCKADLAILNGTATVYEIKSERDSLSRLEKQIEAYKKVFAKIFVIAGENHIDAILSSTSPDIGIMRLSNRYQISTVREAESQVNRINPVSIFESLRIKEAKLILEQLDIDVPEVPNTIIHYELRKKFEQLKPEDAHYGMVNILKRTRNLKPLRGLIEALPTSLKAAALSFYVKKSDHERLVRAMNTRLVEAMKWN